MASFGILLLYLVLLVGGLLFLVYAINKNEGRIWLWLYITEAIAVALALCIGLYYNGQEGTGMMPGLTYMGEVLFSFGAALIYAGLLAVSLLLGLIRLIKRRQ